MCLVAADFKNGTGGPGLSPILPGVFAPAA
jgi:hypothetical protein